MNAKFFTYNLIACLVIFLVLTPFANADEEIEKVEGWFYADDHPEIVEAMGDHEYASGVLNALTDAGTNWVELWGALESSEGIVWSHVCWLIINMPHLDRLEMTRNTLLEHARFAYATRTQLPYIAPQELFQEYILTYRLGDEPVRPWRSEIWFEYDELIGETPAETARAINRWVHDNLTVRSRGFFGSRPDPLSIITAGTGTESDIAAVAIAMCKTFGVPARRARVSVFGEESGGRIWLEIYSDGEWLPMYPDDPDSFGDTTLIEREHPHNVTVVSVSAAFTHQQVTSRYSETGMLRLHFTKNDEPVSDFQHFAISAWNNGAWLPLDDLGFDLEEERMTADEEEGFLTVLGDGFYIVQVGVRNARGDAYVQTSPVTINPDDEVELTFDLSVPASESDAVDLIQRTIDPLPEIDFMYGVPDRSPGDEFPFPHNLSTTDYTCLVIFDSTQEPTIRMMPSIYEWAKDAGVILLGVGVDDPAAAENFWSGIFGETTGTETGRVHFFTDPDGTISEAFGYVPGDDGVYSKLPCVILISPDKEIIYFRDGYNLSVTAGLSRAIELSEME